MNTTPTRTSPNTTFSKSFPLCQSYFSSFFFPNSCSTRHVHRSQYSHLPSKFIAAVFSSSSTWVLAPTASTRRKKYIKPLSTSRPDGYNHKIKIRKVLKATSPAKHRSGEVGQESSKNPYKVGNEYRINVSVKVLNTRAKVESKRRMSVWEGLKIHVRYHFCCCKPETRSLVTSLGNEKNKMNENSTNIFDA